MKKFYLIILFAFLASFGSYVSAETWTKVTTAPNDWSGDYLIVCEAGSVALDGSLTKLDVASNIQSVKITNNQITTKDDFDFSFTIKATDGGYTIKSASGYYIGRTTNKNGLDSNKSTPYTNTLSLINTSGDISIESSAGTYLQYNSDSNQKWFRYFGSNQKAIQLYKKAAADQVAAPTADPKPGTYNEATTVKFTSPEGTIVRVKLGDEYFTPVKNIFTKELTAVNGEKTTYTFEVWTEYNDNNSDRVFYTYTIDPSYVTDSYILCTDIKYLTPGTKVIFVGSKTDGTECKVMTDFDGSSSIRNADGTNVVVSGNTLDDIGNAVVFTVAYDGSATDNYKYSFYDSESNYLGSGTSAKNTMSNQTAEGGIIPDKAKWSISLNANKNYNATILAKEYYTNSGKKYPSLKYNSSATKFACYQSSFASGPLRIYFNAKTSGVEKVALTDKKAKVYGANGNIVVEAETAADVNVYNAAGMLVATQKVGAGRTNIALAKGFYVVRAGNTVTKVAVR